MSRRRSRDRVERPRRGPAAAVAAVLTAIAVAGTVHLANRASAVTADEHALARAQPCAAQGSGNRDCVEDVAGVAVGPLQHVYKSPVVKLRVSGGGTQTTLTFPRGVGAVFQQVQDGDFVALTTWHGAIVSVTAQGDTEIPSAAPSEQYRSRLTATFYAAAFTVVLAGLTLLSAAFTGWFGDSRRGLGFFLAATVIFAGFATALSAAVIASGGSLRAALVTAPVTVAVGLVVAGGVSLWRLVQRRRETERMLRELRAEMS
ncbi:hypothetical protein ABH920_008807 [Catenulispora sp. EB89]|uniref:hypothetical protein n=1 Tax=Catenulispora sp. EB89 TaxID=3156257 RepID=UPI0035123D0F